MNDRLSILCVEDDPDQRHIIALSLKLDPQVDVTCVGSPTRALSVVRDCPPDLVLLDLFLPGIRGCELVRQLQADGYPGPFIYLTASVRDSERDQMIGPNILGLIPKPFDPLTLTQTIRSLLH